MKTFLTTLQWNQRSPSISRPTARKDSGCGFPSEVSNWWSVLKVMSFIYLWIFKLAPFHFYQLSLWSIISGPLIGSNRAFTNVKPPCTAGWVSSAFIRKWGWLINRVLLCHLLQSRQQITSSIYKMDLAFSPVVELRATVCVLLICLEWFCERVDICCAVTTIGHLQALNQADFDLLGLVRSSNIVLASVINSAKT